MTVTLIIPAYNEAERLPPFLGALATFLREHPSLIHEVIVIDDGSSDATSEIARSFANDLPHFHLVRQERNTGKGAAIQQGIRHATSEAILFLDADGATPPEELPRMARPLATSAIVVGNRWSKESETRGQTTFRSLSSRILRGMMVMFRLGDIDTMCGCKAFRRDVAQTLFFPLLESRWLFDQEVLFRARLLGYSMTSVPIRWTSKHGSKLHLPTFLFSAGRLPILLLKTWWNVRDRKEQQEKGLLSGPRPPTSRS